MRRWAVRLHRPLCRSCRDPSGSHAFRADPTGLDKINGDLVRETHLPTEQDRPQAPPRLPQADAVRRRPPGSRPPPRQGACAPVGLNGRLRRIHRRRQVECAASIRTRCLCFLRRHTRDGWHAPRHLEEASRVSARSRRHEMERARVPRGGPATVSGRINAGSRDALRVHRQQEDGQRGRA